MSKYNLNAVLVDHCLIVFWFDLQKKVNNLHSSLVSGFDSLILKNLVLIDVDVVEIHQIFIASFDLSRPTTCYHNYSMPWAKIITIPGSRIMSSLMWVLSQAITTTACFPGILRAVYCSYCLCKSTFRFEKCSSKKKRNTVYRDMMRKYLLVTTILQWNESDLTCDSSDESPKSANQEAIVARVHFPSAPSLFLERTEFLVQREILKISPMWTGHPDSWSDLLIIAWSTASGVDIIPPHLMENNQTNRELQKHLVTLALERVAAHRITSSSSIWSWTCTRYKFM